MIDTNKVSIKPEVTMFWNVFAKFSRLRTWLSFLETFNAIKERNE